MPNMQRRNSGRLDGRERALMEARAKVFKALGHPTRLFIVETLHGGEHCVCKLTELVGADVSTVSRHLAALEHAGVVQSEKRGVQVFYRLRMCCVAGFMECVDRSLAEAAREQMAIATGRSRQ